MPSGSAVRNRSPIATVTTPRGPVHVARQEMRGVQGRRGWQWFWVARRGASRDWAQATPAREAIRRAVLLAGGAAPGWLADAAASAEAQIVAGDPPPTDGA